MSDKYYVAIDLGTNSCRMVIADDTGHFVYNQSAATRLGEGMSEGGCFTPEAFQRGLSVLKEFGDVLKDINCSYRAIATAACRTASNGKEFIEQVEKECGIRLEVIDGKEEARLNLLGAIENADKSKPYVAVYDIGGGSTEVSLANIQTEEIIHTISIPWGARNASEHFAINNYDEKAAQDLKEEILRYMNEFKQVSEYEKYQGKISFIATSSMPLRLSAYIHHRKEYNREREDGSVMSSEEMKQAFAEINKTTEDWRANSVYIGAKRAPIFVAGGILMQTINESLGVDKLTASYKSAKDRIIEELIRKDKQGKNVNVPITQVQRRENGPLE